jgi:hypothetical protein
MFDGFNEDNRVTAVLSAELYQLDLVKMGQYNTYTERDLEDLEVSWSLIYSQILSTGVSKYKRVCFIHACSFQSDYTLILEEILDSIVASDLMDELQGMWVINNIQRFPGFNIRMILLALKLGLVHY